MIYKFIERGSGICIDHNGGRHPYDFSNSTGKILCGFHGHWHSNKYMGRHDFFRLVFQDQDTDRYNYFGLIDRKHDTLKIWRFSKNGRDAVRTYNLYEDTPYEVR